MRKYCYWCISIAFWGIFSVVPAKNTAADHYILFTANINATLQNCGCGKIPLGGIDRIKTFVDSFKTVHPKSIVLDGGDFLNSYPFPELNKAALAGFEYIAYDLIVPGDQELIEGIQFYNDMSKRFAGRILLSNLELKNGHGAISEYRKGNLRFTAMLSPMCFNYLEIPVELKNSALDVPAGENLPSDMFEILVYHGPISGLEQDLTDMSFPDMILLAHDQFAGLQHISGIPVIGAGKDGEQIMVIRISNRSEYEVTAVMITENIKPDPEITEMAEQLKKIIGRR